MIIRISLYFANCTNEESTVKIKIVDSDFQQKKISVPRSFDSK